MRASRRGLVDLIVMIVMIVFLIAMGTLAYITYDKAQTEKAYLAALREIPARQQAELDSVRAEYTRLNELVGFKGDGPYASPEAITDLLARGAVFNANYYDLSARTDLLENVAEGTGNISGTTRATDPIYRADDRVANQLQSAINRQDREINRLVNSAIPSVLEQRRLQRESFQQALSKRQSDEAAALTRMSSAVEGSVANVQGRFETLATRSGELAQALREENEVFLSLDSQEIRDSRERAFALSRQASEERRRAVEVQEAYRLRSDMRRRDDSRDPDGRIFLVDEQSGWVWIDIGQMAGVHLEQTFTVLRPDASRSSDIQIAEIRVKELLRGNIARCRVDALDDPGRYPRAGDLIRNPNFSARQYQRWALVGTFGGEFTRHTRQELTDILRRTGFQVQDRVDRTVEAVIIGGNWMDDPEWVRAKDMRLNVETYPEDEVLHFLGLTGPDRRD
jgi:hypothetical protein